MLLLLLLLYLKELGGNCTLDAMCIRFQLVHVLLVRRTEKKGYLKVCVVFRKVVRNCIHRCNEVYSYSKLCSESILNIITQITITEKAYDSVNTIKGSKKSVWWGYVTIYSSFLHSDTADQLTS